MAGNQQNNFDVIVIGGGPAGAAAAFTCAKHGLNVAIIDKKTFPREKLCGGLFTQRAKKIFERIYDVAPPQDILVNKQAVEFWFAGQELGQIHDFPSLDLTMRWDLDNFMFQKAIMAGAINYSGHRIREIDTDNQSVELDDGSVLCARIIIGGDGVNSLVARKLFGESFIRSQIGFGLEVEVPNETQSTLQPVRIDFSAANWGYGWSFPKRKTTTVGVGGIQRHNPDMKEKMAAYLSLLGHDEGQHSRVKGHFIPFGSFRKMPGNGPVLLCGDAAGLVDPITGEGIAFAMQSGMLAAETAVQTIAQNTTSRASKIYKRKLKHIHNSLWIARLLRPLFFSKWTQDVFMKAIKKSRTLKIDYMRLLAGEIEYSALGMKVLKRLPKVLVMSLRSKG